MPKLSRDLTRFLLPALVLLFAGACETGSTGPDEDGASGQTAVSPSHAQATGERPLRLVGSATLTGQDFAPGFGPPTFGRSDFGGRCSVPSDFVIRFSMKGQATHLGAFSAVLEHCSRIDFQTGLISITDGVATWTAANGDELWDSYERLVPGSAGDPEDHRFIGGTGRFAAAAGEGSGFAVCDRAAGTCDFELDGWIAYAASDRGG